MPLLVPLRIHHCFHSLPLTLASHSRRSHLRRSSLFSFLLFFGGSLPWVGLWFAAPGGLIVRIVLSEHDLLLREQSALLFDHTLLNLLALLPLSDLTRSGRSVTLESVCVNFARFCSHSAKREYILESASVCISVRSASSFFFVLDFCTHLVVLLSFLRQQRRGLNLSHVVGCCCFFLRGVCAALLRYRGAASQIRAARSSASAAF